jgi:hypothetical protein
MKTQTENGETPKTGFLAAAGRALRGACDWVGKQARNIKALVVGGSVAVGASISAKADFTTDPTTIYASAQEDYLAAVTILIGAIGIGAAIMFIRKGLKGRM